MLDKYQRAMVEGIKDADTLKITVGGGKIDYLELKFDMRRFNIRELRHNVALAVQDYFNKANRTLAR